MLNHSSTSCTISVMIETLMILSMQLANENDGSKTHHITCHW